MELVPQARGSDRKKWGDCCSGLPHGAATGFQRRRSPNRTQIASEESERSSSSMHHATDAAPVGGSSWATTQIRGIVPSARPPTTPPGSTAAPYSRIAWRVVRAPPARGTFLNFLLFLNFSTFPVQFASTKQKRAEGEPGGRLNGQDDRDRTAGDPGDRGFDPPGDAQRAPS
jgi:hypothetical protein